MSKDTLDAMVDDSAYRTLFSNSTVNTRSHQSYRVHVVVVDGLRYDQLQKNSALANFVSSISADSWQVTGHLEQ